MPALEKKRSIGPLMPSARVISLRMSCSRPTSAVIALAADLPRHLAGVGLVHVGDDDGARALVGEAQRERAADPAPAPVTTTCLPSSSMARSLLFDPMKSRESDWHSVPSASDARGLRDRRGSSSTNRRTGAARPQRVHERRPLHARAL
jgi:hypothetical protein